MSDIDRIKDRIRKLMAYANDGAASDGEIDNAMRHAAKLMDAHHIDADEVSEDGEHRRDDATMGRHAGVTTSSKLSTWESVLARAVSNLFGCVDHYISGNDPVVIRMNGIAQVDKAGQTKKGRQIYFYGPLLESREAAELFEEWARSIASMGVVRWGGCYRGDGAMYCYGFATALNEKARSINRDRNLIAARAPAALIASGEESTAITLTGRYDIIKKSSREWLEKDQNVRLSAGSRRSGYYAGDSSALAEGRSHGSATQFGRNARRKLLG